MFVDGALICTGVDFTGDTDIQSRDGGRLDLDVLSDVCDERTRIVAASWVSFRSGWRNDPAELAAVAHRHGALLMLDAIQALGVSPLDVQASGVDFFAVLRHMIRRKQPGCRQFMKYFVRRFRHFSPIH